MLPYHSTEKEQPLTAQQFCRMHRYKWPVPVYKDKWHLIYLSLQGEGLR